VWTSLPHTRAAPSPSRRRRGWNFRSASQIQACAIHPREGHWDPLGAEASSDSTPGMNRASHKGLEAVCVDLTSTHTHCALTLAATPGLEFQKRKPDSGLRNSSPGGPLEPPRGRGVLGFNPGDESREPRGAGGSVCGPHFHTHALRPQPRGDPGVGISEAQARFWLAQFIPGKAIGTPSGPRPPRVPPRG
jgi:hypothetical protein